MFLPANTDTMDPLSVAQTQILFNPEETFWAGRRRAVTQGREKRMRLGTLQL